MRTYRRTFNNLFENIVQNHQADFFIHTWENTGYRDWQGENDSIDVEDVKLVYGPKKIIVEKDIVIPDAPKIWPEEKMFRKILLANELRKDYEFLNAVKYDYIVRARADSLFKNKINWLLIHDEKINVPKGGSFGGMNDQFAIAKPELMEIYCSLWTPKFERGSSPESQLENHIKSCFDPLADPIHKSTDINTSLLRTNGYNFDYGMA